ncbi:TrbC/VirB2 family protein [Acidiphilium iwatense]|uniref:TrbC/VirB2 family protein n=1 Tax=Acidiphilium iwatense TaxID=768198 RepID=A0ABS9E001_9PROT|nr:TrbC/VirB2 family protein [Acidiphilium iwatense]
MIKKLTDLRDRLRARAAETIGGTIDVAHRITRYRPVALLATALLMPAIAHAQAVTAGTSPTQIIDSIATFILGPFGEALAVLALVGVGIAFMIGAAGFRLIGGVVIGLIIMFGASYLVNTFVGGGG